ncbi:hypothetical protein [Candidatus Mesenet endosymbiont of Agriotes lineatus]|uniref:hypothetical protein n=1 Tax=Candidatus Mesenet endosymbiont of Agriotes lineatus TaxID=3077948 RepID=UPI0030CF5132
MPRNHKYQPIISCIDIAPVVSCSVTFYAALCFTCPSVVPIAKCISIASAGSAVISTATGCCL